MTNQSLSTAVTACRLCASPLTLILDLGDQPLANSLRSDLGEVLQVFPLRLCRCDACGTLQLSETVAPELLFAHYLWVTGTSMAAREYSRLFCARMVERAKPGPLFALEVASNDGTFLQPFRQRGDRIVGVDPAVNIAEMAEAAGIPTVSEFFGLTSARSIVDRMGQADVVFARNVIPHVADANDVVAGMAHCLADDGTGAIEFHRADVILEELHYDSIYHEHLYFHSLLSVGHLLDRFGLHPFDVTTSPISGGSYVVYFSKTPRPQRDAYLQAVAREAEIGVGRADRWKVFAYRCVAHRAALSELVHARKAAGQRIIGYGASARSSTLLNYCGIGADVLDVVADRAPLKHNKYTPGTNVRIVPPAEALALKPDVILLLGWNFLDEILDEVRREHGWHGDVIVPLPGDPVVIPVS